MMVDSLGHYFGEWFIISKDALWRLKSLNNPWVGATCPGSLSMTSTTRFVTSYALGAPLSTLAPANKVSKQGVTRFFELRKQGVTRFFELQNDTCSDTRHLESR